MITQMCQYENNLVFTRYGASARSVLAFLLSRALGTFLLVFRALKMGYGGGVTSNAKPREGSLSASSPRKRVPEGKRIAAGLLTLVALTSASPAVAQTSIELYSRPGCPRCADAHEALMELVQQRPNTRLIEYDVVADPAALARLQERAVQAGIAAVAVPAIMIGDGLVIGFDEETTLARLNSLLETQTGVVEESGTCEVATEPCQSDQERAPQLPVVPLLGQVDVDRVGLPVFTLAIGLVDGFNPCATWVLLFLLATLVNLKSRSRMALIAGTFVVVSGIVYYAFMAAWLTFFMVVGISRIVSVTLACMALVMGAINMKDFFAFGKGLSLSIPESAKPGIYARMRSVLRAERLGAAMVGIVVLAFVVNLVELLCTAGLPAVYTAILTARDLETWRYHAYLSLYVVAYMFDDAVLVTIGVVTLSRRKLQEQAGRWLKLVSGVTISVLGLLLLLRPSWVGL